NDLNNVGLPYPRSREEAWLDARDRAIEIARAFESAGYHKQIINRLLEPFVHINVIVTSTEWSNFFALRDHEDAQPEIHELAHQMRIAQDASTPKLLKRGEWHLPYVTDEDKEGLELPNQIIWSVARCASV